jgi:hypothetical protein
MSSDFATVSVGFAVDFFFDFPFLAFAEATGLAGAAGPHPSIHKPHTTARITHQELRFISGSLLSDQLPFVDSEFVMIGLRFHRIYQAMLLASLSANPLRRLKDRHQRVSPVNWSAFKSWFVDA